MISAFTLGDITSEALQKSTVEQLWAQTGDVLVKRHIELNERAGEANSLLNIDSDGSRHACRIPKYC